VHGQTFDMPGYQMNFSIAADAAQRRGLSYLAIGDTHAFRELPRKTSPTVYPGAPEATKFGELDAGFVAVVFFPRHGKPQIVQRQQVGRWRWRDEHIGSVAELERLRTERTGTSFTFCTGHMAYKPLAQKRWLNFKFAVRLDRNSSSF